MIDLWLRSGTIGIIVAPFVVIGIGVLSVILWMAVRGEFTKEWNTPVEIFGLYWHFVDIVWIFLFPLLYLVERHG